MNQKTSVQLVWKLTLQIIPKLKLLAVTLFIFNVSSLGKLEVGLSFAPSVQNSWITSRLINCTVRDSFDGHPQMYPHCCIIFIGKKEMLPCLQMPSCRYRWINVVPVSLPRLYLHACQTSEREPGTRWFGLICYVCMYRYCSKIMFKLHLSVTVTLN